MPRINDNNVDDSDSSDEASSLNSEEEEIANDIIFISRFILALPPIIPNFMRQSNGPQRNEYEQGRDFARNFLLPALFAPRITLMRQGPNEQEPTPMTSFTLPPIFGTPRRSNNPQQSSQQSQNGTVRRSFFFR